MLAWSLLSSRHHRGACDILEFSLRRLERGLLLLDLLSAWIVLLRKFEHVDFASLPSLWDRFRSLFQQIHSLALALYKMSEHEIDLHEI